MGGDVTVSATTARAAARRLAGRQNAALMAVPNCSEGRRADLIDRLVASAAVAGVDVLDVHADADHDRMVITLAGSPLALVDSGVALATVARDLIDLRNQAGVHPRVGALDVLPFVAMREADMDAAVDAAVLAAFRIGTEVGVPCLLYGRAAGEGRERPARFRAAGSAALATAMEQGEVVADSGPQQPHASAGVTLVGARAPLVAWNMWLGDGGLDDARSIAAAVRERPDGTGLAGVRALGLLCPETGRAQVSMNIEDYRRTSIAEVVARVRSEAGARGRTIAGSELVGLVPRDALEGSTPASLGLPDFCPAQVVEAHVRAIRPHAITED